MYHAIGEKFKVRGETYIVVRDIKGIHGCNLCVCRRFCYKDREKFKPFGSCLRHVRSDKEYVHFERVGE